MSDSSISIKNSALINNKCTDIMSNGGGIAALKNMTLYLKNTIIQGNYCYNNGGGIFLIDIYNFTIRHSIFVNNFALQSGNAISGLNSHSILI